MNNDNRKIILPVIMIFVLLNSFIVIFKTFLENKGFDREFLIVANLLLFILSLAAFYLQRRALQSNNPNAFVRGVYASMILKLFVCMIAVTIYAFIKKSNINKPALFTSMGIYILYTSFEVAALMKVARKRKNA
jgi:hypothetical protein